MGKGKKGKGKKIIDPFSKKEWYDIKAPCMFSVRNVGKTMVTRSTGTKLASDALKGRVIEISLADLQSDEDNVYRKKRQNQVKKTCYAQSSQIRQIRKKMADVMQAEASSCDLKDLVLKFIPEVIGKEIEKGSSGIFPLQNVFLRKVKMIKGPKFDVSKLMDLHGDATASEETGAKVAAAKAQDAAAKTE